MITLDTTVFLSTVAVAAKFRDLEQLCDEWREKHSEAKQHAYTAERNEQTAIDRLVQAAHDEADSRNLCDDFDDFMEAIGLPRRSRNYRVYLTVSIPVHVTVEARDAEDAESEVDHDDVTRAVAEAARWNSSDIDWSVEGSEVEAS